MELSQPSANPKRERMCHRRISWDSPAEALGQGLEMERECINVSMYRSIPIESQIESNYFCL